MTTSASWTGVVERLKAESLNVITVSNPEIVASTILDAVRATAASLAR